MANPYLGEIRMVGFGFAPVGWASCFGQLLPISENDALFNLIGTTYGGDGQTTFGLPDLGSRRAYHQGTGNGLSTMFIGEIAGTESVTLINVQMPQHTHSLTAVRGAATVTASNISPAGATWSNEVAGSPQNLPYTDAAADGPMGPAVLPAGGNQPHENRPPSLAINFVICLEGIFPFQG